MASLTDRAWHYHLPNNRALWQLPDTRVSRLPDLITRPTENNFTGKDRSNIYPGHSYYVPSGQRKFVSLHERRRHPGDQRPDEIEFQSEDKWIDHVRSRDRPTGWNRTGQKGFTLSGHPELKLDGYCVNPFNLHSSGARPRFIHGIKPEYPEWRGPRGYYGYYHEELETTRNAGRYHYPRQVAVMYNDEDLLKYEYRLTHPVMEDTTPTIWAGQPILNDKELPKIPTRDMTSYH